MALCHTGIAVETEGINKLHYEAESPKEVTFLYVAQEFGYQFWKRTQSSMFVREINTNRAHELQRKYEVLNLLEFNRSRKRMSLITTDEYGRIFLFCKVADE
uniref:Uncharacterized protein n=1 Tax=Lactuca sativa TaxID=4236 RepID=A0A9R1W154_LACSA|nr:hypothetical protein LSAT_V11C300119910 [Lactuca sativa]